MASKASAGSPSTVAPPPEMTENIAYMTLMHELKAAFPNISDEAVKQCVLDVSKNGKNHKKALSLCCMFWSFRALDSLAPMQSKITQLLQTDFDSMH